jgi:DNA-binding NtrC family response regulator
MARVIICDDDQTAADELAAALRAVKHQATTCSHMMDVLREAAAGRFDLVAFGLDRAGFASEHAIEAMQEVAPHVSVIGFHRRPAEFTRVVTNARLSAVLPRPVSATIFLYAVARALEAQRVNSSDLQPA